MRRFTAIELDTMQALEHVEKDHEHPTADQVGAAIGILPERAKHRLWRLMRKGLVLNDHTGNYFHLTDRGRQAAQERR